MLQKSEQKTVFVDLLGEPKSEWKRHELIAHWVVRTGLSFAEGDTVLTEMIHEGTVIVSGNSATLANHDLEETE